VIKEKPQSSSNRKHLLQTAFTLRLGKNRAKVIIIIIITSYGSVATATTDVW
jgi:hypothetical protein